MNMGELISRHSMVGWDEIREWMYHPNELYDPEVCIQVMRRGGYIKQGVWNKLTFNYGALHMSRVVQQVCVDRMLSAHWIRDTPGGLYVTNTDLFAFDVLIRGHQ